MTYKPTFRDVGAFEPLHLEIGTFPVRREMVTIEQGQLLRKGSVIGRKKASGKFILSASKGAEEAAVKDGSEIPMRILSEDVDASEADARASVYVTGAFYAPSLTLGKGHTIESIKDSLELRSIFLED